MRNYRVCDSIEAYAFEKALDKAYGKSSVSCPLKPSDSAPLC